MLNKSEYAKQVIQDFGQLMTEDRIEAVSTDEGLHFTPADAAADAVLVEFIRLGDEGIIVHHVEVWDDGNAAVSFRVKGLDA